MALDPVKNFAQGTLSAGYAAGATSVTLETGDAANFPDPAADGAFNVVWWNASDYADPADDPDVEIVRVTAIATDTLTITRAQESTSDVNHNDSGKTYRMIQSFTAKMITDWNTGVLASLKVDDGTAAVPSITFTSDIDTGLFRPGADAIGVAAGGSEVLRIGANGFQQFMMTERVITGADTAAATDYLISANIASSVSLALASATSVAGQVHVIKKIDASAGVLTLDPAGSTSIENRQTIPLTKQGDAVFIQAGSWPAATTWLILGVIGGPDHLRLGLNSTAPAIEFFNNSDPASTTVQANITYDSAVPDFTFQTNDHPIVIDPGTSTVTAGTTAGTGAADFYCGGLYTSSTERITSAGALTNITAITQTSGVFTYGTTIYTIIANTSDGSDSRSAFLAGGGGTGVTRGGMVGVYGNEHASDPGEVLIRAGDVAGGTIKLITGNNVTALTINESQNATFASTISSGAITATSSSVPQLKAAAGAGINVFLDLEPNNFTPGIRMYSGGVNIGPQIKFGTGSGTARLVFMEITAGAGIGGAATNRVILGQGLTIGTSWATGVDPLYAGSVYISSTSVINSSRALENITGLTMSGRIAATYTFASDQGHEFISTDAANVGAVIDLYHNSPSPAVADLVGQIRFLGEDSGGAKQLYGVVLGKIVDPTAASEDGSLLFYTTKTGTSTLGITLDENQIMILESSIKIKEQASAPGDTAAYGQLWVKNTTPCQLWFTDDAGTDTQIV